jgi:hypothetical protein
MEGKTHHLSFYRSHVLRGNASPDALRPGSTRDAERPRRHFYGDRRNDPRGLGALSGLTQRSVRAEVSKHERKPAHSGHCGNRHRAVVSGDTHRPAGGRLHGGVARGRRISANGGLRRAGKFPSPDRPCQARLTHPYIYDRQPTRTTSRLFPSASAAETAAMGTSAAPGR